MQKKKTNLLFIMTDQQKATSLDLYNKDFNYIDAPGLRSIADEGVTFEAAYCPFPLCVPSRISMLTGVYPSHKGYIYNNRYIENKAETVFEAAKKNGYETMLVGKDHAYTSANISGIEGKHPEFMDDIFDSMYLALHNLNQPEEIQNDLPHILPWLKDKKELREIWGSAIAPWESSDSISARLCDRAISDITSWQNRASGSPFAMWLSFPDPHELYQAPHDIVESIDPDSIDLPPNWESDIENRSQYIQFMHWYFNAGNVPEEKVLKLIRIYLAMCKNVDIYLNKLCEFMKKSGLWEDTLVIFTSDHGDFNGEHQLIQKFNAGYDGCCRVPLVMALPGKTTKGRRCPYPVNLTDIPSTICDIMGWDRFEEDQGESMADILFEENYAERKYTVVESGEPGQSLTTTDISNFPSHRYDRIPRGRWSYDPPHRFGGKMYAVRSRDFKLITRQDQASEFYDYRNDPWESKNVISDEKYRDTILEHYQYLTQHLMKISPAKQGGSYAPQDRWYEAGGDKKWEDCLPDHLS